MPPSALAGLFTSALRCENRKTADASRVFTLQSVTRILSNRSCRQFNGVSLKPPADFDPLLSGLRIPLSHPDFLNQRCEERPRHGLQL